jgi:hypothetical protein
MVSALATTAQPAPDDVRTLAGDDAYELGTSCSPPSMS